MSRRSIMLLSALLAWALVCVIAGCATNPVSGRHEFSLVSADQELQIGKDGFNATLAEYGRYDDPALQAYVDSVGQSLARVGHLPNLQWHFTVLDDPVVNAFAMPGGYIYITRGILAHLNSEAQLAGVLGHETGHVTARHTAKSITQQEVAGLGLGVASIFSQTMRQYGGAAQQALGLLFLKFSRANETQADELGVEYATKANYDPREIPSTYTMLKRIGESSGSTLPGFLSTHPDPGDREVHTHDLAAAAAAGKKGLQIRERAYVRHLEGVVYGQDPRQGYFNGRLFTQPEMAIEVLFPTGWKTQNSHASVAAGEPNGRAQMQLSTADAGALSPSDYVAQLVTGGKVASADGRDETINGMEAWVGRLKVASADGTPRTLAAAYIRRSRQLTLQFLGQSAAAGDPDESTIFESVRTIHIVTDPARLSVTPDRVHLVTVAKTGTFEEVVGRYKPQAIDVDQTSILNNIQRDENVMSGQTLKIVQPGKH